MNLEMSNSLATGVGHLNPPLKNLHVRKPATEFFSFSTAEIFIMRVFYLIEQITTGGSL
jgi:hypothetical protein